MQLQRRLEAFPGGKRQSWNRRKGFVATTAGTGTGRNGSTACGTMACSCSGGSKPFRGADGRPGTVEKDLLRPRQALALEGTARPVALWHAAAAETVQKDLFVVEGKTGDGTVVCL